MANRPLTLDVPERQVLIDFFDDPNGLLWHHRLLLQEAATPGVWVASSPDWEVERLDLNNHRTVALPRAGEFPRQRRGQIYHFDPRGDEVELRRVRDEARDLLRVLGGPPGGVPAAEHLPGVWRIADPSADGFGDELPPGVLTDQGSFVGTPAVGEELYPCGLALIDDAWTFVQQVLPDQLDQWRRDLTSAHGRDVRILGDKRSSDGKTRSMTFREALLLSKLPSPLVTSLQGVRATPEFLQAMQASGMEWLSHHLDFVHKSGLSPSSGHCRTHRRISEALQLFMQHDLVNGPALDGFELLVRYLIQIETAVSRNPRVPDFADLDAIAGSTVSETGALVLPGYGKFVANVQRDEAFTLKQRRQWHEEQEALARRAAGKGAPSGGGRGGGGGDGGGRGGDRGGGGGGRQGRRRGRAGRGADEGAPPEGGGPDGL